MTSTDSRQKSSPPRERGSNRDAKLQTKVSQKNNADQDDQGHLQVDVVDLDDEDYEEKYGPTCTVLGIPCFNIAACGCTKCTTKDKQMMVNLFFLIVMIISGVILLQLAEADAVSKAGAGVVKAATATASLITMWKSIFAFFNLGVMSMIGANSTQSKTEKNQAIADHKTGKIVQISLGAAILTGTVCMGLSFALFETYLKEINDVDDEDMETLRPYHRMVAPTLLLYFMNQVCSVAQSIGFNPSVNTVPMLKGIFGTLSSNGGSVDGRT